MEINNASFKWNVGLIVTILIIDWLSERSLSQAGLPGRSIIYYLLAIILIEVYYQIKYRGLKKTVSRIENVFFSRFRQLFFVGAGSLLIIFVTIWYQPTLGIISLLNGAGLSQALSYLLILATFFFLMLAVFKKEELVVASEKIKIIYQTKEESVKEGRLSQKFPLRHYAHQTEFESIIFFINPEETVLDNGCGDGALAIMLAGKGIKLTTCDISAPNIARAREYAEKEGLAGKIEFLTADAENLPFPDNSFDLVVSSHVLEHLPDFRKGLKEIHRVTRKRAIIAMPTCFNPCAAVILGGDNFWAVSRWSLFAWFVGLVRIILNLGGAGVDEAYSGNPVLPHLWRYPWVMRSQLRQAGFKIIHFEASSLCLPYFNRFLTLIKWLDQFKAKPIIRNFGYGSIAVVEKN